MQTAENEADTALWKEESPRSVDALGSVTGKVIPMANKIARCAIYCRFSSDMQSPRSTADQERECRAFAERQPWTIVPELIERDDAVRAGSIAGRAGYQRLLAAAKERRFEVLLVEEVSRFSRDFLGGLAALAELKNYGVQLADIKTGLVDLSTSVGQLQVAFGFVSSQQETQRLGERSKRGLKGKTLDRFSSGGQPPYGYRRVPVFSTMLVDVDGRPKRDGVRFDVDPLESGIVRRIFEAYADGTSKHGIALALNREGVPTRRAGTVRNGLLVSGTWSTSGIKSMLENSLYIGERIWNRASRTGEKLPRSGKKQQLQNPTQDWVTVPNFAPAIVDDSLWADVQRRLKKDSEKYRVNHIANESKQYLLSGMIRCAACGASFVIGAHRGSPPKPHYRCSFHASRGGTVCKNAVVISQSALEARVRGLLEVIAKDPRQLEMLIAEHNKRISGTNEGQLATVRALEARLKTLEEERDRLVTAIALGTGAVPTLVAEIEKRETEIQTLTGRLSDAEGLVQPLLRPRTSQADYTTGSATILTGTVAQERQLMERLLASIQIYEGGAVVVLFREASLFEPVRQVRLEKLGIALRPELPAERRHHADRLASMKRRIQSLTAETFDDGRPIIRPADLEGGEFRVHEVAPGVANYVFANEAAVDLKLLTEITLASPRGFEPLLAT